jgi:hypothetical protein
MTPDPVVQEMRDNFAKIAEECGNDFDRIIERFRREQTAHADLLVSHPASGIPHIPPTDSSPTTPR